MAITKVTTSGITDDAVNAAKIADGTLTSADIAPGTITTAKLAGSITNAKLANSSITLNGSAVSLGGSASLGSIDWQSVVVSDGSTVTTMVAGRGYFVNNTSAAGIVKLPASASAGDTIAIKDYAGNFGTNNLLIQRNSHKIQGVANDSKLTTNRASVLLVYIDATKGWLYTNESNVADLTPFIAATGGTVTTSGDYKIHTFTGDGNFVVSSAGSPGVRGEVSYLVIAGGGGGGSNNAGQQGGGGGAGGFREGKQTCGSYTASPKAAGSGLSVTAQTYPITVGGGGATVSVPTNTAALSGSNSVFSTITSAGGGGGGTGNPGTSGPEGAIRQGRDGGSGGGSAGSDSPALSGGSGNTPPVSPSQGSNGGNGSSGPGQGGSGGGAAGAGGTSPNNTTLEAGGAGSPTQINASNVTYSAGGPTAANQDDGSTGTANRGNGGGGSSGPGGTGGGGGSGIVIIRYKYQ